MRFCTNSQPAMASSGSVSARRYMNTRSSTLRCSALSCLYAACSNSCSFCCSRRALCCASSAACSCASTLTCMARSVVFKLSSTRVREITSGSCALCCVALRVAIQLLKVSRDAAESARAERSLSCACCNASPASPSARCAALMLARKGSACARSIKSSASSCFSTRGKSPTTVEPRPIRKPAKTKATSHRPRRNHFSDKRSDLPIRILLINATKLIAAYTIFYWASSQYATTT